jgi:hypothetical protein
MNGQRMNQAIKKDSSGSRKQKSNDQKVSSQIQPGVLAQAVQDPCSAAPGVILQMQRLYGNRAVRQMFNANQKKNSHEPFRIDADRQTAEALNPPVIPAVTQQPEAPAAIQRLIGFEVELRVPSFGSEEQGSATFWEAKTKKRQKASEKIRKFVLGGLGYDTEIGGSLKAEPFYRVTSDHNDNVGRDEVIGKLEKNGYIEEVDSKDTSSNLEYVTPAFDELAVGSDKKFEDQAGKLKAHMDDAVNKAQSRRMEQLGAPAGAGYYTGIPAEDFKRWLHHDHYEELEPLVEDFVTEKAKDQVYLQATVGIIPAAMRDLHQQALAQAEKGDLNATAVEMDVLRGVEETVTALFDLETFKTHKTIAEMGPNSLETLRGLTHLLFMYIVGDTITQTSAGTTSTVKNAVPFLIKMSTRNILAKTGTWYFRDHPLPEDLIGIIAGYLQNSKYATVEYWTGKGKGTYQREGGKKQAPRPYDKLITKGTYADFVTRALGGEPIIDVSVIIGKKTLKKPDALPEKVEYESYNQAGIPVEYRWIEAHPTTAGMWGEMKKVIDQARDLNTRHLKKGDKEEIFDEF